MKTVRIVVVTVFLIASSASLAHAAPPLQEPLPEGKPPISVTSTSTGPATLFGGEGILIRLAVGQFDPLSEPGLPTLAAGMILDSYPDDGTGYYLVQFDGPITEADKAALTGAGAKIFDYIPDFTFVVKMKGATRAGLASTRNVRWIGLYQPAYRVAPSLLQTYTATGRSETLELIVVVFKGEDVAHIAEQLEALGGTVLETVETEWKGKIRVQIDTTQIEAIAGISGVKWVEQAPEWQLFNNVAADIMGVRDVWDNHGLYGAGQTIAICDTGLDRGFTAPANLHDDFEDGSGNSRVIQIFDRVGDGASDVSNGHGTHVAGSVLGNGARSGAIPGTHTYPSSAYVGMAPEANLVFQAVERNGTEELVGIPPDLNALFAQADGAGADLHTNSWGNRGQLGTYTSSSRDVDEYVWNHKDFTILFSAGNGGTDSDGDGVVDLDSVTSPGTAKNCITVGASENNRSSGGETCTYGGCWPDDFPANPIRDDCLSDNPNGLAAFSSRGPTNDGRIKPDLVAPGTNIASTRSSMAVESGWGAINAYYVYMGGTSMAAPLAAGAATLVRDFYQDNAGIAPSAALIKATLVNGATDISPGQYGTGITQEIPHPPRPNNVEGWGRINSENSIFPTAPLTLSHVDEAFGLNTGGAATHVYTVTTAGQPMCTTLAWSDYPGSPIADGGLVNDLDLSVTPPGGTTLYPNHASQRSASQHLTYDRMNNIVGIDITSAGTGVYTITVRGYNVPHGPQPYALVVSGAGELGQSQVVGVALEPDRSSTAAPGTVITYTHTLTNAGTYTDTFELDYISSQGWAQVSPTSFVTLATGATQAVLVTITVPSGAISGTVDTTVITATSQADPDVSDTATDTTTVTVQWDIYLPIVLKSYPSVTPPLPSLANGDFEAGQDGSWTEDSQNDWPLIVNSSTPDMVTPHSGDWAVWLGGDESEVAELSQQVSIPAGATSLSLTYWYWIDSIDDCGDDHGWFEVNGTKLKNYALCFSYNTGGWLKETVNFGGYAGQTVTIKFHVDTDADGWISSLFLDDVAFQSLSSAADDVSHQPIPSLPSKPSKVRRRQ